MKRDYRLLIKDIIDAINAIENFTDEMTYEAFVNDDKTASAVIRKFEIIGEASKNLPDSIRKKYPEIPWKSMAGMRDRLIHGYFGVDYTLVWNAINDDIKQIKPKLQEIVEKLEKLEKE